MKYAIHWKLFALIVSLLLVFVLIQQMLIALNGEDLFFPTIFSFIIIALLTHLLLKRYLFLFPEDFQKPQEETSLQLTSTVQNISREKDYLQTVLKGMAEGVLVVDARGRIRMVNESLKKLFPLPKEVVDRTLLETIRNVELEKAIRQAIQEGTDSTFEFILPASPGKCFDVNVVPIPSSRDTNQGPRKVEGAIAVFHDISRLKELEKIRQDFVANVSHELRTPLTTIKGYAETLLEGAIKEEVAYPFVQIIKKQTDRLSKIVEDLLTLSKIESKEVSLNLTMIPISDLMEDVIAFMKEAAGKRNISILKGNMDPSLSVQADRDLLEQALINLLDNAVKYGRPNGQITLSAAQKDQDQILFSVKDDGIGIPKEDLPRIFERFYRVDKGRSQELGGTGLGLSIVKHIIQAHGGKIWAESHLGEGSTFHFTLPSFFRQESQVESGKIV